MWAGYWLSGLVLAIGCAVVAWRLVQGARMDVPERPKAGTVCVGVAGCIAVAVAAAVVALAILPQAAALRVLGVAAVGTWVAGEYGKSVLGGVMGDFLGATICMLELATYLAIGADSARADGGAIAWLVFVVCLPQVYGVWRGRQTVSTQEC